MAPSSIAEIEGRVEFKHVTFGYEPGKPVLHDITFVAEPGEMIGLVGPSGAGKTTLVHLICRFYDADEGQVLVDGHDVQGRRAAARLRQQIGVVLQEPFLFHGTHRGEHRLRRARTRAGGDRRRRQGRQRARLHRQPARRLRHRTSASAGSCSPAASASASPSPAPSCTNPRILILDEATSSVDTETEMLIQEALERLVANRTTFAIAHRLSTLRQADKILVLEHGRLVELGTHDDLLDGDGLYSRLCKLQSELSKVRGV